MSQLRVLVVGASIAGPTTAYWLAKAGANVTVIERFPSLRLNGQRVDIRAAGVTVMRKMTGMEAAVRATLVQMDGMSFVRSDGRPYGVIRATGDPDQQSLISEYEVFRGDLAKVLYDMTKDNKNIKYIFNEQVTSIAQNGKENGPVKVDFMNGLPSSEYDLVVACDGATSRTRAIGLGCGVRDYVHPVNFWSAYFTTQRDHLQGSTIATAHSAVGGRSVGIGPGHNNITHATLWGIKPLGDPDAMTPFRTALKLGDDALREYITEVFQGVGWKTQDILEDMQKSDDLYASEVVQVKAPSIYKGRFAMVGDAGYATGPTGGGTSLALSGGYLLAGEICKHKGDLAAGLQGYEERMRPLIKEFQKIPPGVPGIMAPQTAWALWIRNAIFAVVTQSGILNFIQKYFASGFAHTDQFPLPDYEWVE